MDDVAIDIILDYIEYSIPVINDKHDQNFEKRFSQRWAAVKIIESIYNHPTTLVVDLIEDFIVGMTLYIRDTDSKKMKTHFLVAQQTAEEIGLLFV